MADLSELFEVSRPFEPNESAWRAIERRTARRHFHRRVGSAALGLGMFLGALTGLLLAFNRTVPVFGQRGQTYAAVGGPASRGRGSGPAATGLGGPQAAATVVPGSAALAGASAGGGTLVDLHDEHRQIVDARVVAATHPGGGRGGAGDGAGESGTGGSGTGDPAGTGAPGTGAPGHSNGHGPVQGGHDPVSGGGAGGGSGGSSGGCGGGSVGHGPTHVHGPRPCDPRGGCNLS
jgi:hypothetical protein